MKKQTQKKCECNCTCKRTGQVWKWVKEKLSSFWASLSQWW